VFQIGSTLREARQRQGLELADVERETRIRSRYLAALEAERFDLLPARAYAKGFLRSYADWLGLDGRLFLDEFNSRFPEPELSWIAPPEEPLGAVWALRRPLVLVAVLLVGLVGILAWRFGGVHHPEAVPAPARLLAHPGPAGRALPARSPRPSRQAEAPMAHLLLRARSRCWISVHVGSRDGPVLYEGTLSEGDVLRYTLATVRPQLWLRLGAPSKLDVSLNGKPAGTLPSEPANVVITRSGIRLL